MFKMTTPPMHHHDNTTLTGFFFMTRLKAALSFKADPLNPRCWRDGRVFRELLNLCSPPHLPASLSTFRTDLQTYWAHDRPGYRPHCALSLLRAEAASPSPISLSQHGTPHMHGSRHWFGLNAFGQLRVLQALQALQVLLGLRVLLGLLALGVFGLGAQAQAQEQPQLNLPRVSITAGFYQIDAQIAQTPSQREIGLMYRQTMPQHEGMIFVFEEPAMQCFWMKNTHLPLSAAFVADNGEIVNIEDMKPYSTNSHCSARAVRFVLEMQQGWFAKKNLKAGFRLSAPLFQK
jgi:uncharacterized membrane protein (UPF0127 family)